MYDNRHAVGFHRIERHDGIFQDKLRIAKKSIGKLPGLTACPQCKAVFHEGRWCWMDAPVQAHYKVCPACYRIKNHFPAGFITFAGDFFLAHADDIMHLVHNHEERERAEHPLRRIMAVEQNDNKVLVTTTDIHLARSIGEAVHRAYQGTLEYHYSRAENLLHIYWIH